MAERFTIVDINQKCIVSQIFYFETTSGKKYNLSTYGGFGKERLDDLPYLDVGPSGGITNLLRDLNNGKKSPDVLKWIDGTFHCYTGDLPKGIVKISQVASRHLRQGIRMEIIIDNSATSVLPESATAAAESAIPAAAQPGGSLYDEKGKLLYRGEMKNGVPHGYGTGYYANGKVGHVGMFKGGKIVQ